MVEKGGRDKTEIAQILKNDLANIDFDFNFDDIGEKTTSLPSSSSVSNGKLSEEIKNFLRKEMKEASEENVEELISCFFDHDRDLSLDEALEVIHKMDDLGLFGDALVLKSIGFNPKEVINNYASASNTSRIDKKSFTVLLHNLVDILIVKY